MKVSAPKHKQPALFSCRSIAGRQQQAGRLFKISTTQGRECVLLQSSKQNGYICLSPWVSFPPLINREHRPPSSPTLSLYVALTCSQEETRNGKWIGKTSQPCPPSSSTNDSERLQKITEGSAVHSQSQGRGQTQPWTEVSLPAAPQMPGRKPSIRRACSATSNLQSTIHTSRWEGVSKKEMLFGDSAQRREN